MTREEVVTSVMNSVHNIWNWMFKNKPEDIVKDLGKEWILINPAKIATKLATDKESVEYVFGELRDERKLDFQKKGNYYVVSLSPEPEPEKEQPIFEEDVISLKEITNDMYSDLSPGDKHDRWILNLNAEWYFGMVENDDGTKSVPGGQRRFKDFNEWKKVRYAHLPPNEVVIQIMQNKDVCPYKYSYGVFLTKFEWEKYLKNPTGMFKPTHNSVSDNLA